MIVGNAQRPWLFSGRRLTLTLLLLPAILLGPAAHAEGRPDYYRVRNGDTLSGISQKFRVPLQRLRQMNGLRPGQTLQAGRTLKVGVRRSRAQPAHRPEPVGQRWRPMGPETQTLLPLNYNAPAPAKLIFRNADFEARLYARSFAQGNAAYLEILPPSGRPALPAHSIIEAKFGGELVPLTATRFGYAAVFALAPDSGAGRQRLELRFGAQPAIHQYGYNVAVRRTAFPATAWRVNVGPPESRRTADPAIVAQRAEQARREGEKKARVFALNSANMLTNRTAHPRDSHKITSQFFTLRRIYRFFYRNRRRIQDSTGSYRHRGLDLRGRIGDPIFAMANGRVVCAERMRGEGNFIVIDHGNKIFTGYMHMNRFNVSEGQYVQAGQLLGAAGATGNVTGAHLHMSLWVRGVPLEALSLLSLPIRF
ncbi:MAG: LysM peptidoglycan-binding domain-containing M23 family metallopeptidase [Leptospirales bacterium]|nr:LysM peptidoglycan-binding domain-containing M23 family metallopeptidase [Leptospirales bacterium]